MENQGADTEKQAVFLYRANRKVEELDREVKDRDEASESFIFEYTGTVVVVLV